MVLPLEMHFVFPLFPSAYIRNCLQSVQDHCQEDSFYKDHVLISKHSQFQF